MRMLFSLFMKAFEFFCLNIVLAQKDYEQMDQSDKKLAFRVKHKLLITFKINLFYVALQDSNF